MNLIERERDHAAAMREIAGPKCTSLEPRQSARARSRAFPARARGRDPCRAHCRYSTATPSPIASPTAGVPASNVPGRSGRSSRSSVPSDHAAAAHVGRHGVEQRLACHRARPSPSGRASCARKRRGNRYRAPARRSAYAARFARRRPAPPRRPRAPSSVIVAMSLIVPSVLETCVTATSFGCASASFRRRPCRAGDRRSAESRRP